MFFDINALIGDYTDEAVAKSTNKGLSNFATVTGIAEGGTVYLRFDGESEPSRKQYQRLSGYSPAVGDRVMLMRHSGTVLVIDKVVGIPKPFPLPEPDPPTVMDITLELVGEFEKIVLSQSTAEVAEFSEQLNVRVMTTGGSANRFTEQFPPIIPPTSEVILADFAEEITAEAQIE